MTPAARAAAALLAAFSGVVLARDIAATPLNYRQQLAEIRPGDVLRLAPGDYRDGLPLHGITGLPDLPVIIAGPSDGPPAVLHASPGRNTISLIDASYVVVRDLLLEGHGVPVDGVKAEGHARYAHHITVERLTIRGHGNNQQTVGISTKCPAWNWIIRGNTIVDAGTGIYLGNSNGAAPFIAGTIEDNRILEPTGYALQVKHQQPRPTLAGMPDLPSITVIRRNTFVKAQSGDSEAPRPSVLVGHFPLAGVGAADLYAIYGNLFYGNRFEALFQGEGRLALYANLFVAPSGDAVHIQPHNDIPREIVVAHNTVLAAGSAIRILEKEGAPHFPRHILRNALFAARGVAGASPQGNFHAPLAHAERWLASPAGGLATLDLRPRLPWPAVAGPATAVLADLPDAHADYEGRPWRIGSVGAFADTPASGKNLTDRAPER